MTINDLIKTAAWDFDDIQICAGSTKTVDKIYDGFIQEVPRNLRDAVVRKWKVSGQSQCLRVEIDPSYATVMERYNRKLRIK